MPTCRTGKETKKGKRFTTIESGRSRLCTRVTINIIYLSFFELIF